MVFIKRCRVSISLYFVLLLSCILVLDTTGLAGLALLCAAVHEAGHILALKALKVPVEKISFRAFGINIRLRPGTLLSYREEMIISLSGCAANLLLAGAAYAASRGFLGEGARIVCLFSLVILGFNLLPIGPLDGGRALEAFLCSRMGPGAAQTVINVLSVVFILPLAFFGYLCVVQTGYNFSLIIAAAYLAFSMLFKDRLLAGGGPGVE